MAFVIGFLLFVHIVISLLMVGAVLMQLPRSEGLGAAFGGGITEHVFGAQTTNVLAKATVWLGIAFFVITLLLAMAYSRNQPTGKAIERKVLETPAAAATTDTTSDTSAEAPPAEKSATSSPESVPAAPEAPATESREIRAPEMSLDAATPAPPALLKESEATLTPDAPPETAPSPDGEKSAQPKLPANG